MLASQILPTRTCSDKAEFTVTGARETVTGTECRQRLRARKDWPEHPENWKLSFRRVSVWRVDLGWVRIGDDSPGLVETLRPRF